MKTLALIPARGGSKGLPRKNLRLLAGKPLLAWSIEAARAAKAVERVLVSSDDDEILAEAERWGAEALRRPGALATDLSPSEPLVVHALDTLREEGYETEALVLLQPTSPLRHASDIDAACALLQQPNVQAVISVYEPRHSPYKALLRDEDGWLRGLLGERAPFGPRQALPSLWMPNGAIYAVYSRVFRELQSFLPPNTLPYVMDASRSIDIDNAQDLEHAETLLRRSSIA